MKKKELILGEYDAMPMFQIACPGCEIELIKNKLYLSVVNKYKHRLSIVCNGFKSDDDLLLEL